MIAGLELKEKEYHFHLEDISIKKVYYEPFWRPTRS